MAEMSTRAAGVAFVLAAVAAAAAPFAAGHDHRGAGITAGFLGWPAHFDGRGLAELPLTAREDVFHRDFPGKVGRFTDGRREIIVRWVGAPTRRLHSASDCFRGIGYKVTPLSARKDHEGRIMGCFAAAGSSGSLTVCELVVDSRGDSVPDVSSWYWQALTGTSPGPWWSFVVAEPS